MNLITIYIQLIFVRVSVYIQMDVDIDFVHLHTMCDLNSGLQGLVKVLLHLRAEAHKWREPSDS